MLNRYLGNKASLIEHILNEVRGVTPEAGTVGDLFAGSMVVSSALKASGYNVVANDINDFSSAYGRAFIKYSEIPEVPIDLVPFSAKKNLRVVVKKTIYALNDKDGYRFLKDESLLNKYTRLVELVEYLNVVDSADIPANHRLTHFYDTYTAEGTNSNFVSLRGRSGKRQFFSGLNGRRLDIILNMMRWWRTEHRISQQLIDVLTSITCRAAEQVGNNQGTWHDFPRDWIDTRALKPLRLSPPPFDIALTGGEHYVGAAEDSLEFALTAPPLNTLYLDPPYNFRQYTSYYFLPNIITRYPFLDDPDDWFRNVKFVRGQNMSDDFVSPFCKKEHFIPSLKTLIERTTTDAVILSYFNGRNHWNSFKEEDSGLGLELLSKFFKSSLFERDSLRVVPIPRKNYQSYRGHLSQNIDEYLFVVRKKNAVA